MEKLKFWIALWSGKFFTWLFKHTGRERDDRPGMLSLKICLKFLTYVKKPKLTICVSGTNGKTSISLLVSDMLKKEGYKVACNDWGANANAGHARLLLDSVNIFNRSTKDVAVIETDEMLSTFGVPQIKPDYFIINNLGRDSMFSNANPEYILEHLKSAANNSKDTIMIINGDDPLCSTIGDANKKIYFGVADLHQEQSPHIIDEFSYCLNCYSKPEYSYKNYRHLGEYSCPDCGAHSPERNYLVTSFDDNHLTVKEKTGIYDYPIISNALHNIYNTVTIISLFRELGYEPEHISKLLSSVQITKSRESDDEVDGIQFLTRALKGQNASSASTILEHIRKMSGDKFVILICDEVLPAGHFETITWTYDADFENLDSTEIKRIIITGPRFLDEKLRLLIAGINPDKIVAIENPDDAVNYIPDEHIDKVIIIHDILADGYETKLKNRIKEKILGGNL